MQQAYPIGNGKLGAMPFGSPGSEQVNLNIDSLWWGGPFESSSYNGGNPTSEQYQYLPGIRDYIFQKGTGNVTQLLGSGSDYGTFTVLGNLTIGINGVTSSTTYNRTLDFNTGVHTTTYNANDGNTYTSTVFCSYPDQVCVYELTSTGTLPSTIISFENLLSSQSYLNLTCAPTNIVLSGYTQYHSDWPLGMEYYAMARVISSSTASCSGTSLVIAEKSGVNSFSLIIGADTNYDQTKGDAANEFSFLGVSPVKSVQDVTSAAASKSVSTLLADHITDYSGLMSAFTITLPDAAKSAGLETSVIISRYSSSGSGDPYLESLLFTYGRHLFISSQRENSLPANLQGRWTQQYEPSWGADYHANINLQMNHWGADQTGLGELQSATWNYMQNTWVPRGTLTAQLLYNAPLGWVTHDEMNTFGHTGMKDAAQWANYPASAAWMMQHVLDHYEYSQNATWMTAQGYPLMKGVAEFWLSQLQPDEFFKDGTYVVNPCNSPEHGPTTFGCTHYQQLIYQVFDSILSTSTVVDETNTTFLNDIKAALVTLDKGLHIGTWGEVKEWKLPDSYGYDFKNDTHRHLSQLVGWYPGYSIASFQGGYTNATIQNAVATTLWSRGNGNGADANAGWEKVWRSACWARLNATDEAYFELRYAIDMNFANNGLSMYSALAQPFQIDANFGLVGAILAMLVVDMPQLNTDTSVHSVVLGPAIPAIWGAGSVKGLRLRGGGYVDFSWDNNGVATAASLTGRTKSIKVLAKNGNVLTSL
ncbi:hypothetical protein ACEPPN_017077 [Leptodophora sp. 'Broadleaf-Isolate-01']